MLAREGEWQLSQMPWSDAGASWSSSSARSTTSTTGPSASSP
jgi:hypothetical protein